MALLWDMIKIMSVPKGYKREELEREIFEGELELQEAILRELR